MLQGMHGLESVVSGTLGAFYGPAVGTRGTWSLGTRDDKLGLLPPVHLEVMPAGSAQGSCCDVAPLPNIGQQTGCSG